MEVYGVFPKNNDVRKQSPTTEPCGTLYITFDCIDIVSKNLDKLKFI